MELIFIMLARMMPIVHRDFWQNILASWASRKTDHAVGSCRTGPSPSRENTQTSEKPYYIEGPNSSPCHTVSILHSDWSRVCSIKYSVWWMFEDKIFV